MNPTDVNGVQNSSNRSSDAVPNNEKQPADEHANRIPRARGMNTKKGKKYQVWINLDPDDSSHRKRLKILPKIPITSHDMLWKSGHSMVSQLKSLWKTLLRF